MAKNRNLVFFLGVLASFTLSSFPVTVSGEPPILFTFGDSSYDVGNTKFFSSEFDPATTWPYGDSIDDPSGRWSDGHIVPDFVGRLIGHREPIPPVLDPKADLSRGASFAIAGAVVLGSQSTTASMNFGQQISKFLELHKQWTDKERAEAIYMVNIGAEDYLNFAKAHPNANTVEQLTQVAHVLQRIPRELTSLYRAGGARKFAVQNLGPLGCLPIVRQEFKTGENCMEMVNFMVKTHNERLSRLLVAITVPLLYRGFRYSLFDFNGEILRRINEPSLHGYTDTTTSCCGTGSRNAYGCGYSNVHAKLCSYQKSFLFFDGRHNTEKTDEEVAATLVVFPPPPPVPIPTYITSLGLGYSIAIALGFLVLISTIILSSYICCRASRLRFSASAANANANASFSDRGVIVPRIIFVAEDDDLESGNVVVGGLDHSVINSYPKFHFTKDITAVVNGDGFHDGEGRETTCSICLCEYMEEEMLRMMPECKHYFHVYCLDAWLKLNGSCPVCRNSPLPTPQSTPQSTPLSEVVPLSQYAADRRRSRR